MYCGDWSLVKATGSRIEAVTLRCRAWDCPFCYPGRQAQLIALAFSGNPTRFITLTVRPRAGQSPTARARALTRAWPVIVKRACRKYGYKKIDYFWVLEATKRGEPHLHILSRVPWLDQKWLSLQASDILNAPVVDIRKATTPGEVAAYVCKYVGKAPHRFGTVNRYSCTRTWEQGKKPDTGRAGRDGAGWVVVRRSLADLLDAARADGFVVHLADEVLTALWLHPNSDPPWWAVPR